MKITYSRHARNRMRRDRISAEDVEYVLIEPDHLEPSESGRWNAWRQVPNGWCRVTFIDEDDLRIIVTVTLKRRGPVQK